MSRSCNDCEHQVNYIHTHLGITLLMSIPIYTRTFIYLPYANQDHPFHILYINKTNVANCQVYAHTCM